MIEQAAERRRKMAVHVVSTAEGGAGVTATDAAPLESVSIITDVTSFKTKHGLYPMVQPYINITRKGNRSKL